MPKTHPLTLILSALLAVFDVGCGFHEECGGNGICQSQATLAFTCPANPDALTTRDENVTVDFGNVPLGETVSLPVDISSLTGAAITVTAVDPLQTNPTAPLQTNPTLAFPLATGITVQPSPPTVVQAIFAPTQPGPQSAGWKVLSSAISTTVTLQGNGFFIDLTVSPDPVDFGFVGVGTSEVYTPTVTNGSAQTIELFLNGPDGGPFAVAPLSSQQAHLAPGEEVLLRITYSPLQTGVDNSSFFVGGCSSCASLQVPLRGDAFGPPDGGH